MSENKTAIPDLIKNSKVRFTVVIVKAVLGLGNGLDLFQLGKQCLAVFLRPNVLSHFLQRQTTVGLLVAGLEFNLEFRVIHHSPPQFRILDSPIHASSLVVGLGDDDGLVEHVDDNVRLLGGGDGLHCELLLRLWRCQRLVATLILLSSGGLSSLSLSGYSIAKAVSYIRRIALQSFFFFQNFLLPSVLVFAV